MPDPVSPRSSDQQPDELPGEGTKTLRAPVRDLLVLAWLENLLQSAVGFADSFFVSWLGLTAVAAVGVSNAMLQVSFAIFLAVATSTGVFSAWAVGTERNSAKGLWQVVGIKEAGEPGKGKQPELQATCRTVACHISRLWSEARLVAWC